MGAHRRTTENPKPMKSLAEWTFVKKAEDPILGSVHPPTTAYGKWLSEHGYRYPTHQKPGHKYLNIYGNPDRVDPDKPFGLIVYEPAQAEHHYPKFADALYALQRIEPEDWQVIDLISGDVLAEPKDWHKSRLL